MAKGAKPRGRIAAENRKARYNYEILETFEAGLVLTGTEVKSLRQGKANIAESYATEEVNEQVLRLLRRHGVAGAVRRGSEEGRLLVLVTTNTRGEVFAALTGSADAMVELLDQLPHLQFLELAMSTNNRSRAAMFLLGYEDAVALADGKVEPGAFFADNVLF